MIFIAGVSSRIKPAGSAPGACPACGRETGLQLVKEYSVVTLFFIPVIPFGGRYFATCGHCASVMELQKNRGKEVERRPGTGIQPGELQIVKNNTGPACRACGARVAQTQNFCPNCGERL